MDPNRVIIFDTTLRDGEQSPGISLNATEKLEIAQQLARLGVDVIEAGFPIASPGDFRAVQAIAREVHGPVIAGLARAHAADIERAAEAVRDAERPRVHTFISTSDIHIEHQLQSTREDVLGQARAAVAHARSLVEDVEFSPMDATRADVEFTAEVVAAAIEEGATTINIPDTVGYTMPNEYTAFLGRLYELVPELSRRRAVRALPRRPRPGRGELVRRAAGGRAAGRVRDQRHRRARRQRVAGRDRDAAAHARGGRRLHDGHQHARDRAHEPAGLAPDRLRGAAEQGDRGPQRVPARVRHPPGRRAQGALDLRDHDAPRRSASTTSTRSCSASTPAATRCSRRCRSWATRSSGHALNQAFKRFKELADKKKQVTAMDLEALVTDELRADAAAYTLEWFDVEASTRRPPHATVSIVTPDGDERARRLHRRRPDRRDLPRHQRGHPARGAAARVPHRRGDRRAGRARRGERDPRALGLDRRRPGRLHRHHRGGRARLRARARRTSSRRSTGSPTRRPRSR